MNCAFCDGRAVKVLDFGHQALAGAYLKREQFAAERRYPLQVYFCPSCFGLQLGEKVPADTLFRDYFYFSSATKTASVHFSECAETLLERFAPKTVVEIGCNDGVLLRHLAGKVEKLVGVDPAENVTRAIRDPRIGVVSDYFNHDTAARIREVYGQADLIVANNVFAHVEDIHGVTKGVADLLTDDGAFVIEVHDLAAMVTGLQYDWIYHEHLYYWSLLSLERLLSRHGLRIFDVELIDTHGGSRRYYACKDGRRESGTVGDLRDLDRLAGLDQLETFVNFAWATRDHGQRLRRMLVALRAEGQVVGGYGASGRANALIQHAGLGQYLHCMFDDAPARAGSFTPGSHLHINLGKTLQGSSVPDCLVVFAWTYADEILPKCGDRGVILPFPEPAIAARERIAA